MFRVQSIRLKLILFVILVFIIPIGIFSFLEFRQDQRSLAQFQEANERLITETFQEEGKDKIGLIALLLAKALVQPLYEFDLSEINRLTRLAQEGKDIQYIYIQDEQGTVLVDTTVASPLIGQILPNPFEQTPHSIGKIIITQTEDSLIEIATPIFITVRQLGIVRIGYSPQGIQTTVDQGKDQLSQIIRHSNHQNFKNMLVGLAILSVILGIGLVWIGRLLAPIQQLVIGTNKIAQGNMDYEIPLRSHDEIGELALAFNQMTQTLKENTVSKTYLHNIFESLADSLIVTDTKGQIITVNHATLSLLEYSESELIGQPIEDVMHEALQTFEQKQREAVINRGELLKIETTCLTKAGKTIPISFSSYTLKSEDGQIQGKICTIYDIREQKLLEDELRQSQKMQAVGTLTGGVSHEFSNILQIILISGELFQFKLASQDQKHTKNILSAVQQGKHLVQQLLTFSRPDHSQLRPLCLNPLVNEFVQMIRSTLPPSITVYEVIEADDDRAILANSNQIQQVLVNLVNNAAEAIGTEFGTIHIRLTPMAVYASSTKPGLEKGKYLKLSVQDNGCGMPEDVKNQIFDPFFTTKKLGEGTGLGLSVVHGILQKHLGVIQVESTLHKGTTIDLYFPEIGTKANKQVLAPESKGRFSSSHTIQRILFVDDELKLTQAAQEYFENQGYIITTSNNGEDALRLFQEAPDAFDLLITDQGMPRLYGTELAKKILQTQPSLPIILLTGYGETLYEKEAKAIGITHLFAKPMEFHQLDEVVRNLSQKLFPAD